MRGALAAAVLFLAAESLHAGEPSCIYDACECVKISARCGVRSKGVCNTAGVVGGGFHVDGKDYLLIPFTPRPGARPYGTAWRPFTGGRGSVLFHFSPSDAGYMPSRGFLCVISAGWSEKPRSCSVLLTMERKGPTWTLRSAIIDADQRALYGGETDLEWRPGTWRRLGLHWDFRRKYVVHTVDAAGPDRPPATMPSAKPLRIPVLGPDISIGGSFGENVVPGTYDEIRVYDAPTIPPLIGLPPPEQAKGLYAARMVHDSLEDKRWSNYCYGAVQDGEYAPGFLTSGFRTGTGGSVTYRLMMPDDASRGPFQTMLPYKGTLSFLVQPMDDSPGRLLTTPVFSLSVHSGNRLQANVGQATVAGPVLAKGKFSHVGLLYDAAHGLLEVFHNGRLFGRHQLTPWSMKGAFETVLGGDGAANAVVDEMAVYDTPRWTFPEAAGVLFYASFDRPGAFADFARGRIEALGKPAGADGRWGKGFLSHKYSLLRYPYHAFYRLEQKQTSAVNAFQRKGTVSFWFKPEAASLEGFRRPLVYLRGHGMGHDAWEVVLDNGRPAVRTLRSFRAAAKDPITVGEWRHICLTYDDERAALYIDGEPVLRERLPSKPRTDPNEALPFDAWWAVGSGETGQWNTEGVFDELLLLGRVLYEDEVRALHQYYQSAQSASGLLFPWEALLKE